jgi:hypothetical protein
MKRTLQDASRKVSIPQVATSTLREGFGPAHLLTPQDGLLSAGPTTGNLIDDRTAYC